MAVPLNARFEAIVQLDKGIFSEELNDHPSPLGILTKGLVISDFWVKCYTDPGSTWTDTYTDPGTVWTEC